MRKPPLSGEGGGGGGGGTADGDGDDRRILHQFSIPRFFWVGKFGKYFFEWLVLSRFLFGYSKQSEDS